MMRQGRDRRDRAGRGGRCASAITLCVCLAHAATAGAWPTLDDWADILIAQSRNGQPLPALSAFGAGLTMADAYRVQRLLAETLANDDQIAGFKADLTNPWGQVRLKVRAPVTGVLLKRGLLQRGAEVRLRDFRRLMLAPALGFVFTERIAEPQRDIAQYWHAIGSVIPVVELPDYGFEPQGAMRGEDFVAANSGSARVILGTPLVTRDHETVNGVLMELARDGEIVDRGKARNVMGDQFRALLWLINQLIRQGWTIEPGQLLITGPLGDTLPAKRGRYVARYWDLQEIDFSVID